MVVVTLTGCGGGAVNAEGSTSMDLTMSVLTEAYEEKTGTRVNFSGTGSGAGIQAALAGTCDLGMSSRALTEDEKAQGAVGHLVALDGIAVVVNRGNPVEGLTGQALAAIFTGEVTNWKELGGEDEPIAVYGREAGSGTRAGFEEALGLVDQCRYTSVYTATGDIVGGVARNPGGIGYVSLSGVGDAVKSLAVDGAACTEENLKTGAYPLSRPFLLVTNGDRALSHEAQGFLDFAVSDEVSEYLALAGVVAPS
jgi:phosphate transport system substrate-binding protein